VKTCSLWLALVAIALVTTGCSGSSPTSPSTGSAPYSATDLVVGTGAEASAGRIVVVNYTGWLYDSDAPNQKGQQFDTTSGRGPFTFVLGAGGVIRGWDQGVSGMKVGGQRRLVIPPDLAYGSTGAGNGVIPPNATLVFDIELLLVQ
jgi:FKBP-type peptidyl-prolyl cis-trans isomerase FkpA